ncbi:hypothetical protein NKH77_07510 [Streptomyces sp. M19]
MLAVERDRAGPEYRAARRYWHDRLADLPEGPELPWPPRRRTSTGRASYAARGRWTGRTGPYSRPGPPSSD